MFNIDVTISRSTVELIRLRILSHNFTERGDALLRGTSLKRWVLCYGFPSDVLSARKLRDSRTNHRRSEV